MEMRQLRYFCALGRYRSFTRAAESLHIAQPPLSRQIQLLEEEIGVQLVQRGVRPIQLTEAGRFFYEQALQVLGRIDQMLASTRQIGRNERAVLSIGYVASTLYSDLPLLVRRLRTTCPELDIRLVEIASMQQVQALKEQRIDIGFGRLRHHDPVIACDLIREERLALAIPQRSPLAASADLVVLAQMAIERLIIYPKDTRPGFADHVLDLLHSNQVEVGEVLEAKELQGALGLVAAEMGVCVVPESSRQLRSDIHYRPIAGEHSTSPIILNYRKADASPHITLIKSLVQELHGDTAQD